MHPHWKLTALSIAMSLALPAWAQSTVDSLGSVGAIGTYASGVNAAGNVVVGYEQSSTAVVQPFRWTQSGGMVSLGLLTSGPSSIGVISLALAVNAVGDVVVGYGSIFVSSAIIQRAFRWTQSGGMVNLGVLNGGGDSSATAVNAAGDVVVGTAADGAAGNARRAFRWTQASGMISLGTLNGGATSQG